MKSWVELFDVDSGNVIEDYERESDAIEALIRVVETHGSQAIATFALTVVTEGTPQLIAMENELVQLIERQMRQLVPQRRTS